MPEGLVRLEKLIRSFHCLEDCPADCFVASNGKPGFHTSRFVRWAVGSQGGGGTDAALFILSLVNSDYDWSPAGLARQDGRGYFVASAAVANWDPSMREAFAAWAADPSWYR